MLNPSEKGTLSAGTFLCIIMRFLSGLLPGLLGGILYIALTILLQTAGCGYSPNVCTFLTRWPLYQSYPLANLEQFIIKQPMLGIPPFTNFSIGSIAITTAMLNTIFLIGVIGGIISLVQADWRWRKIAGVAILWFLFASFVIYMVSFSACGIITYVMGDGIFFACDPPPPFWTW